MLSDIPYTKVKDNRRRYDVWVFHDVPELCENFMKSKRKGK